MTPNKRQLDKELFVKYTQSWIKKDVSLFLSLLNNNVHVTECFGASYRNKNECEQWFRHWNDTETNGVREWSILFHSYDDELNTSTFEWFFDYKYKGESNCFNGVTLLIAEDNLIMSIKEFEAKSDVYYPYE
ncbi:hypothetical protein BAU15_08815 [Enterococcus sp. JM4C]|uniref:nuclear transport factor 2 family protein n=1 Tax=Candidatus Enterococcus huntleyi TaxID=1857217 RepID=UPI0013798CCB|nr:nuclear transport factor 2 family protein [Enterococcus sp. JM4C]KAF1296738.1 hypothetical protein BAU15_08815 [Enterococcus sp. JM4C]